LAKDLPYSASTCSALPVSPVDFYFSFESLLIFNV
jgi:hypothetical protein